LLSCRRSVFAVETGRLSIDDTISVGKFVSVGFALREVRGHGLWK
jgi:hypothetical protein